MFLTLPTLTTMLAWFKSLQPLHQNETQTEGAEGDNPLGKINKLHHMNLLNL